MSAFPTTSSGLQTADAIISAAPGRLRGVTLITDGTNAATIIVYDNASAASGTVLAKFAIVGSTLSGYFDLMNQGVVANLGLYADISGTGANYIVYYDRG